MRTTIRFRAVWLLALVALVAILALSACGARGRRFGGNTLGSNTPQQTTQSAPTPNVNLQDIQNTDQQLQDALNALNAASNAANQDFSAQDTETVP
jgi:hypothetical protein